MQAHESAMFHIGRGSANVNYADTRAGMVADPLVATAALVTNVYDCYADIFIRTTQSRFNG